MRINNENLLEIDNVAQSTSLAASRNFKPIWLGHICNYSIQLVYTGVPDGSFKLQASNDLGNPNAQGEANQYAGVSNWSDISGSATGAISAAGDTMYDVENAGYRWVRVVWTATGAGTAPVLTSARANVKGV